MAYEMMIVEKHGAVGVITLDRPKALNALSSGLMEELGRALDDMESDDAIGCMILTGSEKAFAPRRHQGDAGKDVYGRLSRRLYHRFPGAFGHLPQADHRGGWRVRAGLRDRHDVRLHHRGRERQVWATGDHDWDHPGAGGTQRLTRFVGKAKAMDMCLTGRMMDAEEAERSGVGQQDRPGGRPYGRDHEVAERIAAMSRPATVMAKESVNRAYETTLSEGVRFERRLFHSTFSTEDQKEGMAAFVEKRQPSFRNK